MESLTYLLVIVLAITCSEACKADQKEVDLDFTSKSFYNLTSAVQQIQWILKGAPKKLRGPPGEDVSFNIKAKEDKKSFEVRKLCLKTRCVSQIFMEFQGIWPEPETYLDEGGNVQVQLLGPALGIQQYDITNPLKRKKTCIRNLGYVSNIHVTLSLADECKNIKAFNLFSVACAEK